MINLIWFRRDLRVEDNKALAAALQADGNSLPIFIFDTEIIDELPRDDARISFIYDQLEKLHEQFSPYGSSILIKTGNPVDVFEELCEEYEVNSLFFNRDYEPYAISRDKQVTELLQKKNIQVHSFKDHVIFEPHEVLKNDNTPYTVYTPYKNKWKALFQEQHISSCFSENSLGKLLPLNSQFPSLSDIGLKRSAIRVEPFTLEVVSDYKQKRDFPMLESTSKLGPHLRFGTVGVRQIIRSLEGNYGEDDCFLNELIWREFFIQIMYHYPHVIGHNFRKKYDGIVWRNNEQEFKAWCEGKTGYPIVDAGMRELNATGYMHNRVRMITAGFLCKHLLIDWRWGEAYFAKKLLDFELASNNGNWQWAAGTGCDAAPYFRVFNPTEQVKKFDKDLEYIRKWVPELDSFDYPSPIVEHKFARERAIATYKEGIN